MKIVAFSDPHGDLPHILDPFDVMCICGDIVPLNIQRDYKKSLEWLQVRFYKWWNDNKSPNSKLILIWGNHDFVGEKLQSDYIGGKAVSEYLWNDPDMYILFDESVMIDNKVFYGTSWCPQLENWAFYRDDEELKNIYHNLPQSIDVLLTHCPPKHNDIGRVLQTGWNMGNNFGCKQLEDAIRNNLKGSSQVYIIGGHIHSGNHEWDIDGNLHYCNVSLKDEQYRNVYDVKCFEI